MQSNRSDPDVRLLRKIQNGDMDDATWHEFVKRIRVWICLNYPSLCAEADDLAGDAALCAFVSAPSFRGDALFMRWVYGIARHVVHQRLRKQFNVVILSLEEVQEVVVAADEVDEQILQLAVEAAMQTLTDQERTVFTWRSRDGLDHKEISRRLGITSNASRQTWMRAAAKIGRYWRENQW